MVSKLSLNIEKSKFVLFHPSQRNIYRHFNLAIDYKIIQQDNCIKYLGIFIDSNLSWKSQVNYIAKKVKRGTGFFLNFVIMLILQFLLICITP